ncbi:hypothetical protein [Flindersiella endophytica]
MRVLSGVAAAVLALAAVPGLLAGSVPANAAPESRQIATGTAGDFKVVVTATKGAENPPTAAVTVEGFERSGDSWKSVGSQPVGDEWFWFVVTDKGGICDFSVADTPEATTSIKVNVSSSVECAPAETFHVDNGRLVHG